jgi:flagellar hook protein FlgE
MQKPTQWFLRNAQQVILARASTLPVIARTGSSSKTGQVSQVKISGEGVFIVGKSKVGGPDRVGGTPE